MFLNGRFLYGQIVLEMLNICKAKSNRIEPYLSVPLECQTIIFNCQKDPSREHYWWEVG